MKDIVIIGPNVGMGGVERASSNLANGFVEEGLQVTYLSLIPKEKFYELKSDYIEPLGFNMKKMDFFKTMSFVRKTISQLNPSSIIVFTKFYGALVNLALFGTKHRIIITERSSPFYVWPQKIEMICKFSFRMRKPHGVISQTLIASEHHKKYYGKTNYVIIPNALRKVTVYPNVKRKKWILAVGRLQDPCKGFDLLVNVFNHLKNVDWELVFVGGNEMEGNYLIELAKDETIKKRIVFLGKISEIDKIYAQAGIFVMPSRTEGFPNALLEAMGAGCCCVSFDFIAGPRDIINDGVDGLIVPKEDIKLMAKAIDDLIESPKKRLLFESKAVSVVERFNEKRIVKLHLQFINEINLQCVE